MFSRQSAIIAVPMANAYSSVCHDKCCVNSFAIAIYSILIVPMTVYLDWTTVSPLPSFRSSPVCAANMSDATMRVAALSRIVRPTNRIIQQFTRQWFELCTAMQCAAIMFQFNSLIYQFDGGWMLRDNCSSERNASGFVCGRQQTISGHRNSP